MSETEDKGEAALHPKEAKHQTELTGAIPVLLFKIQDTTLNLNSVLKEEMAAEAPMQA